MQINFSPALSQPTQFGSFRSRARAVKERTKDLAVRYLRMPADTRTEGGGSLMVTGLGVALVSLALIATGPKTSGKTSDLNKTPAATKTTVNKTTKKLF